MNSTSVATAIANPKARQPIASKALRLVVLVISLPYHRFFLYNTLRPAEAIAKSAPHGTEDHLQDWEHIFGLLKSWRQRKKGELEFVSIAGIAITAIVTATLSWGFVEKSHWVGIAFFYASLIMSIISLLLAAQQTTLLALLGEFPEDWKSARQSLIQRYLSQLLTEDKSRDRIINGENIPEDAMGGEQRNRRRHWRLSWKMVMVWQTPMMCVAYSFLWYIVGLSVMICSPLVFGDRGDDAKIAYAYIATSAAAWGIFAVCSLYGYQNVSLDKAGEAVNEQEAEMGQLVERRTERIATLRNTGKQVRDD